MPPVGFETTIPTSERPQAYALDGAVTGTGVMLGYAYIMTDIILPHSEDNLNFEVYRHAGSLFRVKIYWLFNNICVIGEMPEWGKIQYRHTCTEERWKTKVKNCRVISLLNACYKLYGGFFFKEKLKAEAELPFWNARIDFEMAYLGWIYCLA